MENFGDSIVRCYNGCPDDELLALLEARSEALAKVNRALTKIRGIKSEVCATYHHPTGLGEYGWRVHEWGTPLSGFHSDLISACMEALSLIDVASECGPAVRPPALGAGYRRFESDHSDLGG